MRFKPYPKYKPSGVEWLKAIPEDWTATKLKRGFEVCLGKMLQPEAKSADDILSSYLRAANIKWEGVDLSDVKEMWFSPTEKSQLSLLKGDLLVSEGGDVGRSSVLRDDLNDCYFQNSVNRVRARGSNSTKFLYYWLQCIKDGGYIDILCNKSTIAHFTAEKVESVDMLFPSPSEQSSITSFLDRETAKIDTLIAKQEKLIELLKEKRQAIISHAVTKGLNPNVKMKDSGIEWLGEVPEHWEVAGLTKYMDSVVDYRGRTPEKVDDGVFLITAKNIRNGAIDYEASQEFIKEDEYESVMSRGKPHVGDVLFTTEAPLGQVANINREDIALAQRIIKFRGMKDRLNNYYLKYWIMGTPCQFNLTQLATGSTALGIKGSKVGMVRLCLPPLNEQHAINKHLNDVTLKIDGLVDKAEQAIALQREHRTALISAAVTGKIDVRYA